MSTKTVEIFEPEAFNHKTQLFDSLYRVSKKDLKRVCNLLTDAFSKDPYINTLGLESEEINEMFEVFVRYCIRYGSVYATSKDLEGIMVITPNERSCLTMWKIVRSGAKIRTLKTKKKLKNEIRDCLRKMEKQKKNLGIGSFISLGLLGVSQEHQGKGFGRKMLRAIIEKAEDEGVPIYLETQSESDVKLSRRYGFLALKEYIPPNMNSPVWQMIRYSHPNPYYN